MEKKESKKLTISDVKQQYDLANAMYKMAKREFDEFLKKIGPSSVQSPAFNEIHSINKNGTDLEQLIKIRELKEELELRKKLMLYNKDVYLKVRKKYRNVPVYSDLEKIIIEENINQGISLKDIAQNHNFHYDYVRHVAARLAKRERDNRFYY